jgi:ketosteroid isomerase-like protein
MICCLALAALSLSAAAADRTGRDSALRVLQPRYEQWRTAFRHADMKSLEALQAPDMVWITVGRQELRGRDLRASLQRARSGFTDTRFTIDSAATRGNEIIATVAEKLTGTRTDPDGTQHVLAANRRARHTWKKLGDAWKVRRVEVLRLQQTVDGRPVPLAPGALPLPGNKGR